MTHDPTYDEEYAKEKFFCPKLRSVMNKESCGKRHTRRVVLKWYGGAFIDSLSSSQDRFCNTCPLGALRAKHLKMEIVKVVLKKKSKIKGKKK